MHCWMRLVYTCLHTVRLWACTVHTWFSSEASPLCFINICKIIKLYSHTQLSVIRSLSFISSYMFQLAYRAIFRLVFRVVCMYSCWGLKVMRSQFGVSHFLRHVRLRSRNFQSPNNCTYKPL
jgi:hypothetical protein